MKKRIGILGFAHGHINAYCGRWRNELSDQVELVAGWDHDAERLTNAAVTHGFTASESLEQLLSQSDIDAIVIGSETAFHAEHVEAAAAAKKTIILQKPIALNLDEANRIVAAINTNKIPFTMAWQMRVDPENLKMKELVDSGEIGRVLMARRRHCLKTHQMAGFEDTWHYGDFEPCSQQIHRIAGLAEPLADFISGNRPPLATAEEGRTALRMLLASNKSAEEGRRIRISDVR